MRRSRVDLCFVCLGNICRSPTAAAVMTHLVARAGLTDRIGVESAGTSDWHIGEPPDRRAAEEAHRRKIAMRNRGSQFTREDFGRFDLVLAMDEDNHDALLARAPTPEAAGKVALLRSFDPAARPDDQEVPDPYFGDANGFGHVFDLIEAACRGLLAELRAGSLAR